VCGWLQTSRPVEKKGGRGAKVSYTPVPATFGGSADAEKVFINTECTIMLRSKAKFENFHPTRAPRECCLGPRGGFRRHCKHQHDLPIWKYSPIQVGLAGWA